MSSQPLSRARSSGAAVVAAMSVRTPAAMSTAAVCDRARRRRARGAAVEAAPPTVASEVDQLLQIGATHIEIDASTVAFADSSALRTLLNAQHEAAGADAGLCVTNAPTPSTGPSR